MDRTGCALGLCAECVCVELPGRDLNWATSQDSTVTFSKAGYISGFRLLWAVWIKHVWKCFLFCFFKRFSFKGYLAVKAFFHGTVWTFKFPLCYYSRCNPVLLLFLFLFFFTVEQWTCGWLFSWVRVLVIVATPSLQFLLHISACVSVRTCVWVPTHAAESCDICEGFITHWKLPYWLCVIDFCASGISSVLKGK